MSVVLAVTSVGYLLYAGYLLKRFEGIGVKSLSVFTGLWGANFLLSAVVIYVFTGYGITDGAQLGQLQGSVPARIQPVLASEALFSGLLSVGAIFAWLWFVLRYTRRIGRRACRLCPVPPAARRRSYPRLSPSTLETCSVMGRACQDHPTRKIDSSVSDPDPRV